MPGIVGNDPQRFAFDARKSGDDSITPMFPNFQIGIHIHHGAHDVAYVVVAQSVLWHDKTELALIRRSVMEVLDRLGG